MEIPLSVRRETIDILAKKPELLRFFMWQIQAGFLVAPALIYYQQP